MQKHKLVHFFQKLPTLPFDYFSDMRRSKGQQAITQTAFGYPLKISQIHDFVKVEIRCPGVSYCTI